MTMVSAKTITISKIADANASGVEIGVQSGTTSDIYAEDNLPDATVKGYDTILLAESALETGDVDLIMGDKPVLDVWIATHSDYAVLDSFSEELFGLAVDDGETQLLAALNKALTDIIADTGSHGYDAFFAEWFPGDISALRDDSPSGTTHAYPAVDATNATGDLKDVLTSKKLKFGNDPTYPPFENKKADGTYEGFDIDMMDEIVLRFSTQYGITIVREIVDSDWDPIIPNLQQGVFHVILSAMTKTAEREVEVDFTRAYYGSIQGVVGPSDGVIDVGGDDGFLPLPIIPIALSFAVIALVIRIKRK